MTVYTLSVSLTLQVNKMLKPEKWQGVFDSDGKVLGFQKALKSMILGVGFIAAELVHI